MSATAATGRRQHQEEELPVAKSALFELARQAGELALTMQRDGLRSIQSKSTPNDLVTEADLACEAMIRDRLASLTPDFGFWGEESDEQPDDDYFWLVDPIDGTINFAAGLPWFGINIALIHRQKTFFGLSLILPQFDLFWAQAGHGAYLRRRNGEEQRLHVSQASSLSDALLTTGFPYHRAENEDNNAAEFARIMPICRGRAADGRLLGRSGLCGRRRVLSLLGGMDPAVGCGGRRPACARGGRSRHQLRRRALPPGRPEHHRQQRAAGRSRTTATRHTRGPRRQVLRFPQLADSSYQTQIQCQRACTLVDSQQKLRSTIFLPIATPLHTIAEAHLTGQVWAIILGGVCWNGYSPKSVTIAYVLRAMLNRKWLRRISRLVMYCKQSLKGKSWKTTLNIEGEHVASCMVLLHRDAPSMSFAQLLGQFSSSLLRMNPGCPNGLLPFK